MSIEIDRSKCGTEYSLCPNCKHEDGFNDYCQFCTQLVNVGYDFLLCGIPVGTGFTHLHRNYEPKEKGGADNG